MQEAHRPFCPQCEKKDVPRRECRLLWFDGNAEADADKCTLCRSVIFMNQGSAEGQKASAWSCRVCEEYTLCQGCMLATPIRSMVQAEDIGDNEKNAYEDWEKGDSGYLDGHPDYNDGQPEL